MGFNIMDSDGSGYVDREEFINELHKFRSREQQTMLTFLRFHVSEIREMLTEFKDSAKIMHKENKSSAEERLQVQQEILQKAAGRHRLQLEMNARIARLEAHLGCTGDVGAYIPEGGLQISQETAVNMPSLPPRVDLLRDNISGELERLSESIRNELVISAEAIRNACGEAAAVTEHSTGRSDLSTLDAIPKLDSIRERGQGYTKLGIESHASHSPWPREHTIGVDAIICQDAAQIHKSVCCGMDSSFHRAPSFDDGAVFACRSASQGLPYLTAI